MTRFEMDYAGMFGEYWKKDAENEVANMKARFEAGEVEIEEDGAAKWVRSGHYLPEECVAKLAYAGIAFSAEATDAKRKAEDMKFFAAYRKHSLTHEMAYEMRAAFGPGTKVVDVISGATYEV